jgi:mannose-6-phosphate isomerase-like protein (cupin superfamily)
MNEVLPLDNIDKLKEIMRQLPQVEFETHHYFADGMYCRELPRKAGTVIVGKVHKREHFYVVLSGEITISGNGEIKHVKAPHIFVCQPGTRRAVYAHTDAVCMTIHRTLETDLEKIEAELVEDEDSSYLPGNVLKTPLVEVIP